MAIRIDAKLLIDVLRLTPPEQNILLMGKHGIGKSEIITAFFREQGRPVISFFLGQMSDPGDLIGLMHKDESSGRSVFLPPFWWPSDEQPIVLFLDELNRARPEILQSVHDLALNKTLAGKRLPSGSVVIAAVNTGDEYQLTDLDPALVSRFNLYEFAPSVEDWLLWANDRQIDQRVLTFIQESPQFLDSDTTSLDAAQRAALTGLVRTPDRRAWVRVSNFLKSVPTIEELHIAIIAGIVGTPAATAFRKSAAKLLPVTPEQILLEFTKHKKKLEKLSLQGLVLLNEQIVYWVHAGHCPLDKSDIARDNLLAYMQHLQQAKQREAIAHLVSILENPKFARSMEFAAMSPKIIALLTEYIQGIKAE